MSKTNNNNINIRRGMMRKCRAIKLAVNKFRDAVADIKKFSAEDKILIRIVLDNLLAEVRSSTEVMKRMSKKSNN